MLRWLNFCVFASVLFAISSCVPHQSQLIDLPHQWQVHEITLTAERDYPDPFDINDVRLLMQFRGPDGQALDMPGFWDGERSWKVRFAAPQAGQWRFISTFSHPDDAGLHGQDGSFVVQAAESDNALYKHGGFLAVSENRRYLTYTDGTPFFWLADTWWTAPSATVPLANFKEMVAVRKAHRFTAYQAHGFRAFTPEQGASAFEATSAPFDQALGYWHTTDVHIAHGAEQGLVGLIGFAGGSLTDKISLEAMRRLWWYYLARYGAYPISFLFTQEYNKDEGRREERIAKMLALGEFIKRIDPYKRALSIHPWHREREQGEARDASWLDFIMLQGGHFSRETCERYLELYNRTPIKPVLESEANYEGFSKPHMTVDAAVIRRTAYTAIQCGSLGFSYGAQGLYAGIQDVENPGPTVNWGPPLTWRQGLAQRGGAQMAHLRNCYEQVEWWTLSPHAHFGKFKEMAVSANPDTSTLVTYYPQAGRDPREGRQVLARDGTYAGQWCNPRSAKLTPLDNDVSATNGELPLPPPPTDDDWLLLLQQVD